MYEWYIYAISDDVDGEDAQGGRRALTSVLETLASSRTPSTSVSSSDWTSLTPEEYFSTYKWSGEGSKWDNVGKPVLIFTLRASQVVNFWNPLGKASGAAAMAVEEGLVDPYGEWLADVTG